MANEVRITVGADTKTAEKALKSFRERLDGVAAKARKVGIGLSAMGAGGILAIKGFTSAALEQERAIKVLASVVGSAGESFADVEAKVMATTAALQKKTNFGDEAQIRVLAKLVPMLGSTDAALAALPAVMEVATVTGKDFNSVVDTMGPVLAGMTNRIRGTSLEFEASQGPMERVAHILETLGGAAEADIDPFIQMGNAMGDVKETIGSALLPIITPLIEKITKLAEWLQTINPAILKWGAGILAAATALGALGGPLLIFLSFMPKIIMGLKGMAMATLRFNMAILANPFVLVFAAIAGALALFVVMWSKNMGGIRETTRTVFVAVGDFMVNALNKMIRGLQIAAEKLSVLIPQGIEDAIAGIKPLEFETGAVFDNIVLKTDDFAESMQEKLKGFLFPAVEEVGEFGDAVIDGIDLATSAMDTFGDAVDSVSQKLIKPRILDFGPLLEGLDKTIDEDVSPLISKLRAEFADMDLVEAWELVYDEMTEELEKKFTDERALWKEHYDKITETVEDAAARIKKELTEKTAEAAKETAENLAKAAKAAEDTAARIVAAAARVAAAFGNWKGALGQASTLVGPGAASGFVAAAAGLTGRARVDAMVQWGEDINAAIAAAIPTKAHGGFIGGPEGAPSLAMVHGGELVLNRSQQAEMGSIFNITINGSVDDPQLMARHIADEVDAVIGRNALRNEQVRSR